MFGPDADEGNLSFFTGMPESFRDVFVRKQGSVVALLSLWNDTLAVTLPKKGRPVVRPDGCAGFLSGRGQERRKNGTGGKKFYR